MNYLYSINNSSISLSHDGMVDREWKEHKWVDRKRDPKTGKWIYNYGDNYSTESLSDNNNLNKPLAMIYVDDYDHNKNEDSVISKLNKDSLNKPLAMIYVDDYDHNKNEDSVISKLTKDSLNKPLAMIYVDD